MLADLLMLLGGLIAVTFGADFLTDGASSIAKRLGVTEFLIGMTIVAIGTSLPEMVVSIIASLKGSSDLSVGNIIGSNTCNIFLILGLTALIVPIPMTKSNIRIDIPIALVVTILFTALACDSIFNNSADNIISRVDGIIFLVMYVIFLLFMIKTSKTSEEAEESSETMKPIKAIVLIIIGFILLIFGAKYFVDGATAIARLLNVSEAVIGITIVAIGTSLPELATSFVAAIKGKSELAIGNILGSNIANILLIMGLSSVISPLKLNDISMTDFIVNILGPALLMLIPLVFRTNRITRSEGILFLLIYVYYSVSLII